MRGRWFESNQFYGIVAQMVRARAERDGVALARDFRPLCMNLTNPPGVYTHALRSRQW